jgi:hypothetical protein
MLIDVVVVRIVPLLLPAWRRDSAVMIRIACQLWMRSCALAVIPVPVLALMVPLSYPDSANTSTLSS